MKCPIAAHQPPSGRKTIVPTIRTDPGAALGVHLVPSTGVSPVTPFPSTLQGLAARFTDRLAFL